MAWFFAAARTIDGPPMSISSISSSMVMPGRSSAAANGYRFTTTMSNGAMAAASSWRRCSSRRRSASKPAWIRGCNVFTRPSSISGNPVTDATSVTGRPASRSVRAVPPVDTSSIAAGDEAAAQVRQPALVRDREERPPRDRDPDVRSRQVDDDAAAVVGDLQGVRQQQRDGPRQQPVLDGLDPGVEARDIVVRGDGNRLLGHDRPTVERRVDEMDRAAGHGRAVRQRVANRVRARERRQQARMRVEDPAWVGGEHRRPDEPHVPGEDDRVGRDTGERVRDGRVVAAGDQGRLDPLLRRPRQGRTLAIREHEREVAAELAASGRRGQGSQVRAGAGHAHGDARPVSGHASIPSGPST